MPLLDANNRGTPTPPPFWARAVRATVGAIFGIGGSQFVPTPDANALTGADGTAGGNRSNAGDWQVFNDRRNVMRDVDRMDAGDEIVFKALNVIANQATSYDTGARVNLTAKTKRKGGKGQDGFRVASDDKKIQRALNALASRLKLDEDQLWQIARRTVKYGSYLPEVMLDRETNLITELRETIPYEVWPVTDGRGHKVNGPSGGWVYRREKDGASPGIVGTGGGGGQAMEEWQICPFHFGPQVGFFRVPLLAPARYGWKRLQKIEDNLAIQRLRATDRLVHRVVVAKGQTQADIKTAVANYIANVTKSKRFTGDGRIVTSESPLDEATDFYIPEIDGATAKGGVDMLAASHGPLANLTDVLYARERLIVLLGVPISYLQLTSSQKTHLAASSGISGVDKDFAVTLRQVQRSLLSGLKRLFDLQLSLLGFLPGDDGEYDYEIELPRIESRNEMDDAKIALYRAQAAVYANTAFGALPLQILAETYMDLTPDQQALMLDWLGGDGRQIMAARVKAIKEAAKPKATGAVGGKDRLPGDNSGGSGNDNKDLAARSTEQIGGAKQSMAEAMGAIFEQVQARVQRLAEEQGLDVGDLDLPSAIDVAQAIEDAVEWDELLLLN